MGLDKVKEWLHYCGRCNSCKYLYRDYRPSCPAFEKFQWESYTSSGKVWIAYNLSKGKFPLTETIRDKIFSCTLCGNCTVQCQQEISNHALDIFEALREECIEQGVGPIPIQEEFRKSVEKVHNPYGAQHEDRWADLDEKYFKSGAENLFFIGCTTALRNKDLLADILSVLDTLDVDYMLSKEEWCCGSPLLTTGQTNGAKHLAEHNLKLFKNLGVKRVITACAGCFRTLNSQYSKKFPSLNPEDEKPVEIVHLSQFLAKKLTKKHFRKDGPALTVTFHDPCHLGRHSEVYDEPRKVIELIPNVKLVEMPRNRENAWCCGAGAGVKSGFKDWAVEISEDRMQEALELNAEHEVQTMISTCPFCERNLTDAVQSLQEKSVPKMQNYRIMDLVQLVKRYLRTDL